MSERNLRVYLICALIYILFSYTAAVVISYTMPNAWYLLWVALFVINAMGSAYQVGVRIEESKK